MESSVEQALGKNLRNQETWKLNLIYTYVYDAEKDQREFLLYATWNMERTETSKFCKIMWLMLSDSDLVNVILFYIFIFIFMEITLSLNLGK